MLMRKLAKPWYDRADNFALFFMVVFMESLSFFVENFFVLSAEASPWLLLGLLIAGLMKAWVPSKILSKHLGKGKLAVVKAAFIGAPLPLCSCGVIPVATELRRSGASAPATASFLVATPETGIDSVSVSYALLGPVFAIYRPFAAIMSAIVTGLLVSTVKTEDIKPVSAEEDKISSSCCSSEQTTKKEENVAMSTSCCASEQVKKEVVTNSTSSCCSSNVDVDLVEPIPTTSSCCSTSSTLTKSESVISEHNDITNFLNKTKTGIYYAATKLIDDIIVWLVIGLVFASLVRTFLPEEFLLSYGSGLPAMLLMIAISIPMYICATASTPIAAGFIMAGLSPGTALVFMMAGPATNISTLGVIKNEMGGAVLVRYLLGVALSALGFALLLDFGLNYYEINISEQMSHAHELLPQWFGLACAGLIAFLAIKPLRKLVL